MRGECEQYRGRASDSLRIEATAFSPLLPRSSMCSSSSSSRKMSLLRKSEGRRKEGGGGLLVVSESQNGHSSASATALLLLHLLPSDLLMLRCCCLLAPMLPFGIISLVSMTLCGVCDFRSGWTVMGKDLELGGRKGDASFASPPYRH